MNMPQNLFAACRAGDLLHRVLGRRVIVPGNLVRYRLFALPGTRSWRIYLHQFIGPDPDRKLHDHPKRFVSIGLRGGYTEIVGVHQQPWSGDIFGRDTGQPIAMLRKQLQVFRAPWFRSFPPTHIHKIVGVLPGTWTLVFVGRVVRPWGFWRPRVESHIRTRARLTARRVLTYELVPHREYGARKHRDVFRV